MGRKKQGKFERSDNKGKDKRHKMKGKSLETFTEEMHGALQGKNTKQQRHYFLFLKTSPVFCRNIRGTSN